MSYQKVFPKILEKTYASFKSFFGDSFPMVERIDLFGRKKFISLPFLDTIYFKKIPNGKLETFLTKTQDKVEIRLSKLDKNFKKFENFFLRLGFSSGETKGHIVSELTTQEEFWKRFHKHTRNDIRKAEKSGLNVKKINCISELKKFYKIYFRQMKNFGTPQHSFKFFKNCFDLMNKNFFGLNCYKDKKLIGSIILFLGPDYSYVSFNVSDPKFRKFRPNDFLYWESIKYLLKKGIKFLDLGQIDFNPEKGSRAEALLKFKRKWLGKEYPKVYFTKNFNYRKFSKKRIDLFRKIWVKIPNFIARIFGPKIISNLE